MILLHHNIDWAVVSDIATVLAFFAAALYTWFTYDILKQTAKAANQNATANELSAYLALRKDLCTPHFSLVTQYARSNKLTLLDKPLVTNGGETHSYEQNGYYFITKASLITDILNNVEDLALFHERNILTIETIDSGFGYTILNLGNNTEINQYINKLREHQREAFNGFIKLYGSIYNMLDETEKSNYLKNPF